VLAASRQAGGKGVSAETQVRIAQAAASVGAFTAADAALARAGAGTAHVKELAADLATARAQVALPRESAKLGIAPDDEPRYVAAYWLAIRAVESRNRAAAERRLAELTEAFPDSAGRDVAACELALSAKRAADAEKSCQAALTKDPDALRARLALGRIAASARRYPDAEKQFRRVLLTDPADPTAWSELGHLYRVMRANTQHDRLAREYEALYAKPLPP
jgi:tetratricopeptide (TPR) repeat protein